MTRVIIFGAGAADLAIQLESLGLTTITTVQAFRDLAERIPVGIEVLTQGPPAPAKFGGDRPYLKRKKGRS
jgi:hypothetical protein